MDGHPWFLQLRKALKDRRVPARYANRLVEELWLHYIEMKEQEEMNGFIKDENSFVARLGSPEHLAAQAASLPKATWSGRHPWLAFVVGAPVLTLCLVIVCLLTVVFGLLPFAEGRTLASDPWMGPVMMVLGPLQVIIPSSIACIIMFRLVRRSVRSPWWAVGSCALITLLCMVIFIQWAPPVSKPGSGMMSVGFGLPIVRTWFQAIVPLLIGIVYAIKNIPQRKSPVMDNPSVSVRAAA